MKASRKILIDILDSAEKKDYSGYSKFDALNSRLLKALCFNNKWLRLFYTQAVKEFPFNIRPLLRVKKSKNPKGIALFARAYLLLFQKTSEIKYLDKAESLIQWLLENPSPGANNLCWGYNFIWQNTIFLQDEFEPNAVVSVFVGETLIHAYRVTRKREYLDAASSVASFIVEELPVLHDSNKERAIAYVLRKVDAVVLNNQVLSGAFLVKVWKHLEDRKLLDIAWRQINYTVNRRTEYGCWYYTYPKEKSPIRHDNYHTGGILDGLLEYCEETGDERFMQIYWEGLVYYQNNLFDLDGAPRWMSDTRYPYDIHGAAQGIISFVKGGRYRREFSEQAEKIADWAIDHLYRRRTRDFAYREGRFIRWNYPLMRWSNAWMARALAELTYTS
jgi:rhamnogalacturonyl hydrolase YesR